MDNFRLWLESKVLPITPTLRIRLTPGEVEMVYWWLVDFPRGTWEEGHVRQRMTEWILNNLRPMIREEQEFVNGQYYPRPIPDNRSRILSFPINLDTLPIVHEVIEDLKYWHSEARRLAGEPEDESARLFLAHFLDQIEPPYIKLMNLNNIAEKAPPEWKNTLLDAISHNDINRWLVYADFIEERGQRRYGTIIRKLLTT